MTAVPLLIGGWLLLDDWRHGRSVKPYLLFCTIWLVGYIGTFTTRHLEVWREFTAWSARVQGEAGPRRHTPDAGNYTGAGSI